MSGVGTVTRAIGGMLGALTTLFLIVVIGIYLALEPRLYERGVAWMLPRGPARRPRRNRRPDGAQRCAACSPGACSAWSSRASRPGSRCAVYGVPMAALLGLLTGLLAFLPNIGALISGALMVLVGFSGGTEMGHLHDRRLPRGAERRRLHHRADDRQEDGRPGPRAGAGAQLIMGVLFGMLGLALADPLVAMIKIALERRAHNRNADDGEASRRFRRPPDGPQVPLPRRVRDRRRDRGRASRCSIWSKQATEIAFVPRGQFVSQPPLDSNAYDDPAMWYSRPGIGANDPLALPAHGCRIRRLAREPRRRARARAARHSLPHPAKAADASRAEGPLRGVLRPPDQLHPPRDLLRCAWNAPLDDAEAEARARLFLRGMASPFNRRRRGLGTASYRQAVFGAFLTDKPEAAEGARRSPIATSRRRSISSSPASPKDTPIVLAGHSQGALHVLRLLREKVAGTPLAEARSAMVYPIGWPISVDARPARARPARLRHARRRRGASSPGRASPNPPSPSMVVRALHRHPAASTASRAATGRSCASIR